MKGGEFRRLVLILKTAIGRADEVFRRVLFSGDEAWVTDGCLKLWVKVPGIRFPDFSASLDAIWAFAKHVGEEIEIRDLGDHVALRSGEMVLVMRKSHVKKTKPADVHGGEINTINFKKGLDYVSRPLDEDDGVELHVESDRTLIIGAGNGISAVYVLDDLGGERMGLRMEYQSVRRTVKVLEMLKSSGRISVLKDEIVLKIDDIVLSLCAEQVKEKVEFPEELEGFEIPSKPLLKLLEKGADIFKRGNAKLVFMNGRLIIKGEGHGILYTDSIDLGIDGKNFEAEVPVRKLRSYISNFGTKSIRVGILKDVVVFRNKSGVKSVFVRGRPI